MYSVFGIDKPPLSSTMSCRIKQLRSLLHLGDRRKVFDLVGELEDCHAA
jgi:hypothetical protein